MKNFASLELGFPDAEDYKRRENKNFLNKIFIRNQYLDKLLDPAISFLIGEKGTGKTAYAIYLSNNDYNDTLSSTRYLRETEYRKFIYLKNEKHLGLSDYSSIWKVIIYLLLSQQLYQREGRTELFKRFTKLKNIQDAINEYYKNAFSPEIIQALEFVQDSNFSASLMSKYVNLSQKEGEKTTFSESKFQINLF